jgi:hypothetical protein
LNITGTVSLSLLWLHPPKIEEEEEENLKHINEDGYV